MHKNTFYAKLIYKNAKKVLHNPNLGVIIMPISQMNEKPEGKKYGKEI